MSKVDLIKTAKSLKKILNPKAKHYVSYCRRIERVKTDKRICAMTFDDGPTYSDSITKVLVETLNDFGAKGTFDIIGTTENNYPDKEGVLGTPSWSGVAYDHYPLFGKDKTAGAVNCPDLIDLILSSGHEITNHTYSHILFGKKNIIYSKRKTLGGVDDVFEDISRLHSYMLDNHGYEMKFSRPPHYVDKIRGGATSYDVYSLIGYNYLAASFDGAGWLPCDSYDDEVEAMVAPLKNTLEKDPNALCGQIIFQKDGYNMSLRAPVKDGLKRQLQLLKSYGYEVVTVSDLLKESPFADLDSNDPDYEMMCALSQKNAVVFTDNTVRLDSAMTKGELAMLIAPREISVNKRLDLLKAKGSLPYGIKISEPYSTALAWALDNGYLKCSKGPLTIDDLLKCKSYFNTEGLKTITRREIYRRFKMSE